MPEGKSGSGWTWFQRIEALWSLIERSLLWISFPGGVGVTVISQWLGFPLWQAAVIGLCALIAVVVYYFALQADRRSSSHERETLSQPSSNLLARVRTVAVICGASVLILLVYSVYIHSLVQGIRKELDCSLAPRRLMPEQITTIGAYLLEHKPNDIVINWAFHDERASDYEKDFREAFRQGNWRVKSDSTQEEVLPGITVFYHSSEDTQKADAVRRPHDPPNPGEVMEKALKRAELRESVKLRYSSDRNLKYQEYKVTLFIGSLKCKEIAEVEKN